MTLAPSEINPAAPAAIDSGSPIEVDSQFGLNFNSARILDAEVDHLGKKVDLIVEDFPGLPLTLE